MRSVVVVVGVMLSSCSGSAPIDAGVDAAVPMPDAGEACWEVSADACAAQGCRAISGHRSTDAGVRGSDLPFTLAGCKPAGELCGTAITYGQPPDSGTECWQFMDTCIPLGWTRLRQDSTPLCPTY